MMYVYGIKISAKGLLQDDPAGHATRCRAFEQDHLQAFLRSHSVPA